MLDFHNTNYVEINCFFWSNDALSRFQPWSRHKFHLCEEAQKKMASTAKNLFLGVASAIVMSGCGGKGDAPTPTPPPVTPPPVTPTKSYVVKTVGINSIGMFTKLVSGKMMLDNAHLTDGAGTVVDLSSAGNDLTVEGANFDNASIDKSSNYPVASFPKYTLAKAIKDVVDADSAKAPTIKLKGFKNASYDQVNLVLVQDGTFGAQTVGYKNVTNLTQADINSSVNGKTSATLAFKK
jgi:hypothetical protein